MHYFASKKIEGNMQIIMQHLRPPIKLTDCTHTHRYTQKLCLFKDSSQLVFSMVESSIYTVSCLVNVCDTDT